MANRIILRNGTASEWSTHNPVLEEGEVGLELDTGKMKVGDGSTSWKSLNFTSLAKNIEIEDINELFHDSENVEEALVELFTNVSSGKDLVGGAITDVDDSVVIPTDPTFGDLASAISGISTGKKWASGETTEPLNAFTIGARGLSFKPSIVINIIYDGASSEFTIGFTTSSILGKHESYRVVRNGNTTTVQNQTSRFNVYSDGFEIFGSWNVRNHWIAFE